MLNTLGETFSRRHFEVFFLDLSENRIWHFMQILFNGGNLLELSWGMGTEFSLLHRLRLFLGLEF